MTNLDEQIEELIKERNAFEAEAIALKAQKFALCGALDFMMQRPFDEDDYINMVRQCNIILDKTDKECVNDIKVEAYEQGFRYSCAVYNGGSSKEVIDVVVNSYKDELEDENNKP